jgi:hypothetical protein
MTLITNEIFLFKAFCQSCQDTFKYKFHAADVNKNGLLNLNELTALAGQPPFENKKPEDMFRIVSKFKTSFMEYLSLMIHKDCVKQTK